MKKLFIIIIICLFGLYAQSQNNSYEGNANTITNFASSGAPTAFGLTKSNVVNAGVFSDTSAANAVNYLKNYNGCQIVTYSGGVKFWIRYGGSWNQVSSGSSGWGLLGNAGTVAGTNFIGTTDNQDFYLKTNNNNAARFYTTGKIDFNSGTTPAAPFTNSAFRFFLDQNDRTDVFVSNHNTGTSARAGFSAENDNNNYLALTVLSTNFTVPDITDPTCWANKTLFQTAGVGKGAIFSVNEGNMEFKTLRPDSTDANIWYSYNDMTITGASRHSFFNRQAAVGSIGMGINLPKAQLDIFAGQLNATPGIDYEKLFRASAKMPTSVSSPFSAFSIEVDDADSLDKMIFEIKADDQQVLRVDKNSLRVKDLTGTHYDFATSSSIAEFSSTTKGLLIPRMTETERDAISSPAIGLQIYNTTDSTFNYYRASGWTAIGGGGSSQWITTGSDIYYTTGKIGIGTTSPAAKVHSLSTSEQLRLGYDATYYNSFTTSSTGGLTIKPTHTGTAQILRIGENSYSANNMFGNVEINYSGSLGYGQKGLVFRNQYDGGAFTIQNIGGTNTAYFTTTSGTPSNVSCGGFENPNSGSVLTLSSASMYTTTDALGVQTNAAPDASASLEVKSTTKGFLPPRMTTTQMNAISSPATGLKVFNTTDSSTYDYRGTTGGWQSNVYSQGPILFTDGANKSVGVSAAMTAGTITISNTRVTANSRIFLTHATVGGTQGILSVGTITAGTSFVINSSSATDTGTVNWFIIN